MIDWQDYKYKAFISYSHSDEKWARWLHRSLENYRVPKRLVGQPSAVAELRHILITSGADLARALAAPPQPGEPMHSLFPGHPRFPSEVAFARFLNFNAIAMRETPALRGFLYSDRS